MSLHVRCCREPAREITLEHADQFTPGYGDGMQRSHAMREATYDLGGISRHRASCQQNSAGHAEISHAQCLYRIEIGANRSTDVSLRDESRVM